MKKTVGRLLANVLLVAISEIGKQELNKISKNSSNGISEDVGRVSRVFIEKIKDLFMHGV
jgi:hypothetical protein